MCFCSRQHSHKFWVTLQLSSPFFLASAEQSEVVAATLSSAGGELLQLMPRAGGVPGWTNGGTAAPLLGFDAIIVDEAAQVRPGAAGLQ